MAQTALINILDLQTLVGLSINVKEQVINPHIISAQNWQLKDLLGRETLKQLEGRKCTNELTDTDKELLEFITPFLSYHAYSKYIRASTMLSTATGVVSITGDNAFQPGRESRLLMAIEYENNAEAYVEDIVEVLTDNPEEYPDYVTEDQRQHPKTYFI